MNAVSEQILDELSWRGLIAQSTDLEALGKDLAAGPLTLYCGFDPTAESLHGRNLRKLLTLARLQRAGHRPVVLAGGATGQIVGPRDVGERSFVSLAVVATRLQKLRAQLRKFGTFDYTATGEIAENNL